MDSTDLDDAPDTMVDINKFVFEPGPAVVEAFVNWVRAWRPPRDVATSKWHRRRSRLPAAYSNWVAKCRSSG